MNRAAEERNPGVAQRLADAPIWRHAGLRWLIGAELHVLLLGCWRTAWPLQRQPLLLDGDVHNRRMM